MSAAAEIERDVTCLLLGLLLASCATVDHEAAFWRVQSSHLEIALATVPDSHIQRCEILQESADYCHARGYRREWCGYNPFDERMSELGCGITEDETIDPSPTAYVETFPEGPGPTKVEVVAMVCGPTD